MKFLDKRRCVCPLDFVRAARRIDKGAQSTRLRAQGRGRPEGCSKKDEQYLDRAGSQAQKNLCC
jgi:hypothetical protein